ncbi:MAG: hypothetical protein ACLUPK_08540 [Veillonella sp.]
MIKNLSLKKKAIEKLIDNERKIYAAVVAQWTGIPVAKIAEEESATLLTFRR